MAGNTALDSDNFDSEDSGLNALLGRLDDLGDSNSDAPDTASRGLHSVPDLADDYDYSSIAAINPDAMGAAIDPAPVELTLVPDFVEEDDAEEDDVVEDDAEEDDVVEAESDELIEEEHAVEEDDAVEDDVEENDVVEAETDELTEEEHAVEEDDAEEEHAEEEHAEEDDAEEDDVEENDVVEAETDELTEEDDVEEDDVVEAESVELAEEDDAEEDDAESTPVAHATEEKVDHFADLDDGETPRIAGVQSEPVRPKIEAQDLVHPATTGKSKKVHPAQEAEFDRRDEFGVLADPLDIKEITPTHPDDANPEELLNHGVYFHSTIAGNPWAKGLRARPGDLPEEEAGKLPVRLLLVATLLVCMIGVAVMLLNNSSNVEAFSSLFG